MITIQRDHWYVTRVDQSNLVERIVNGEPIPQFGVRVHATASGPRYTRWAQALRDGDRETSENLVIHAVAWGRTFEEAIENIENEIIDIEAANPVG